MMKLVEIEKRFSSYVCVCFMCVCVRVCVRERERETERVESIIK